MSKIKISFHKRFDSNTPNGEFGWIWVAEGVAQSDLYFTEDGARLGWETVATAFHIDPDLYEVEKKVCSCCKGEMGK